MELEREAEAIFASSGEVIIVSRDPNSDSALLARIFIKKLRIQA